MKATTKVSLKWILNLEKFALEPLHEWPGSLSEHDLWSSATAGHPSLIFLTDQVSVWALRAAGAPALEDEILSFY